MDKCYVSGQISGLKIEYAKQNFYYACKEVQDYIEVIAVNPFFIKPLFGIKKWFFYMVNDIRALRKCQYIAMQRNWKDSKGACIEHFYAKFIIKIKVIYL